MALTKLTDNLDIISALENEPNDVGGLTAEQLKEKFDEAGNLIKTYINDTLTPEADALFATRAELQNIVLGQIPDGTITNAKLESELSAKIDGAVQPSEKGQANGVASLDENGVIEGGQVNDARVDLSPDVATALGLTGNSQVKDALAKITTFGVSRRYFTSSETFTAPYTGKYFVELCGAGARPHSTDNSYGGCGAGYAAKTVTLTKGQQVYVTVGSDEGLTSSFGSYCSATGGVKATSANTGGTVGYGVGGDVNLNGGGPSFFYSGTSGHNRLGGACYLGRITGEGTCVGWGNGAPVGSSGGIRGVVIITMLDRGD